MRSSGWSHIHYLFTPSIYDHDRSVQSSVSSASLTVPCCLSCLEFILSLSHIQYMFSRSVYRCQSIMNQ